MQSSSFLSSSVSRWCLLSVSLAILCSPSGTPLSAKDKDDTHSKTGGYSVVQVGSYSVEVVPAEELGAFRKRVAAEHREAVREHSEAKKEARRNKEKFSQLKPPRQRVRVLAASVPTEQQASALRNTTLAKINSFVVLQIGTELHVVRKSAVRDRQHEIRTQDKEALERFRAEKTAAKRNREAFREKAPSKTTFKVVATGLQDESAARERAEKLLKKNKKLTLASDPESLPDPVDDTEDAEV